jgi:hypothetical protein
MAVEIAGEPGTEQRVDREIGSVEEQIVDRQDHARPGFGRASRIAVQGFGFAEQPDLHVMASRGEKARRNEAVSAIVARAAEDDDATGFSEEPFRLASDGCSGLLHEEGSRRSGFDGQPVCFGHFEISQERFEHCEGYPKYR